MPNRVARSHLFRHSALTTACALALLSSQPASADSSVTVGINNWLGSGNTDWFHSPNWWAGELFNLPKSIFPVYIGPTQIVVNGIPTDTFDLPSSEAVLGGNFSTSGLDMRAWDGISQMRLTTGALLTVGSGTVGGLNAAYHLGGAVQKATLVLAGGQIAGSWSFLEHSRVVVAGQYGVLSGDWSGTLSELQINQGASLSLPGGLTVGQLNNAGALRVDAGRNLTLSGSIQNAGSLTLGGSGNLGTAALYLAADTTLVGSGSTVLTDPNYSYLGGTGVLTVGAGHTLRGSGYVAVGIANQGQVIADGVLTVNGGGTASFDNSAGLVQVANAGLLTLSSGTLRGGTLQGLGAGSRLGGSGSFQDVALQGTWLVAPGNPLTVAGSIVNTGTLTIAGSGNTGTAALYLAADTTLAGSGRTVLTDPNYSYLGGNGVLTVGAGHTLSGSGYVAVGIANQGQVLAVNGDLQQFTGSTLRNQGQIQIQAGGTVDAVNVVGGLVQDAADAVTNVNGVLKADSLLLEAGTLQGSGTVQANVINLGGTIAAGNSPGMLSIDGDLTLGSNSLLLVEVAGPTRGTQYDWIKVSGDVVLGGTLQLDFGSYTPQIGEQYSFLTSASGHISRSFANAFSTGYTLTVDYGTEGITATVSAITAVPEPATYGLMLLGLGLLGARARRQAARM